MMTSEEKSEVLILIRREIEASLNVILNGAAQDAAKDTESISQMFPGQGTIPSVPTVKPYGFHSRAPDGVLSVCARVGAHRGSRYVIGHRDGARPEILTGESTTYSVAGYEVRVELGRISIRKGDVAYTAVVGEVLSTLLSAMLQDIASHTHTVVVAVPGVQPGSSTATGTGTSAVPGNAAAFTTLKGQVDGGSILAKDGGAF